MSPYLQHLFLLLSVLDVVRRLLIGRRYCVLCTSRRIGSIHSIGCTTRALKERYTTAVGHTPRARSNTLLHLEGEGVLGPCKKSVRKHLGGLTKIM